MIWLKVMKSTRKRTWKQRSVPLPRIVCPCAMAVTICELHVLIEASVQADQKSEGAGRLDERHLRRMDMFDGKNWEGVLFPVQDSGGLSQLDDA